MKYRRYRCRKLGHIFRKVCRGLCGVGFLVALGSVGRSDIDGPLGPCFLGAVIGIAAFAGFGYLGGLFR